jgi:P27 family predicted phage terminase small subunit
MGHRGPPPKPTPLRVLEGNRGHRPLPPEPTPEPGPCDAPEHLSARAKLVWDRLSPELEAKGLLAPRYLETFEMFCEAVVQWRIAAELVARTGPVVTGYRGSVVTNPASREFQRYAVLVRAMGADFGLSPAAVSNIARGTPDQVDRASPARLMG